MPVNTPCEEYKNSSDIWMKCRDAAAGEEAIKSKDDKYLPRLGGASEDEYQAYKRRAMFYSATGRTIEGLSGAVVRKPASIEWPVDDRTQLKMLGQSGEPLEALISMTVEEVLTVGRIGLLVDADEQGKSVFVCPYLAENIFSWRTILIEGRRELAQIVLREEELFPSAKDEFVLERKFKFRVLRLVQTAPSTYTYFQDIYVEQKVVDPSTNREEIKYVFSKRIQPKMEGGKAFTHIPFVFVGPSGLSPDVSCPPLKDLINVNISHYMNSADLEHGRHFTALPTPWVAGFDPKVTHLTIGSGRAWVANSPESKCGMLEFTGAGLRAISDGMDSKERLMAVLGARLLEDQKDGVEAFETVKLRHAGEQASLTKISISVSQAFTKILQFVYMWKNPLWTPPPEIEGSTEERGEICVELNRDFSIIGINAPMLEKLMIALQSGAISWETWCYCLGRGEVLPDGVDASEEARRIAKGLPGGMGEIFREFQGDPNLNKANPGGSGTGKKDASGGNNPGKGTEIS